MSFPLVLTDNSSAGNRANLACTVPAAALPGMTAATSCRRSDVDEMVVMAAQQTTAALARDARLPDLWHLLSRNPLSRDYSYPGTATSAIDGSSSDGEDDVQVKRLCVLPEELLRVAEEGGPVLMGLLEEIGRGWMASGSALYLFDARGGSGDVVSFEVAEGGGGGGGESTAVLNVAYCTAIKPGVFSASVTGILVVVSAGSVQLVAITSGQDGGEFNVHATDFAVSTDDINMLAVHVTTSGRIFLGGADGCLYELEYGMAGQSRAKRLRNLSESFFSPALLLPSILRRHSSCDPVTCVVSSDVRLFVLFESSKIDVYNLKTLKRMSSLTNIQEQVDRLSVGFLAATGPFRVLSIHPITTSQYLCLIAVTSSGARIYLTSLPRERLAWDPVQLSQSGDVDEQHVSLSVVHVRLLVPPSLYHPATDPRRLIHRAVQPAVHAALASSSISSFAVCDNHHGGGGEDDELVFAVVAPTALFDSGSSCSSTRPLERASVVKTEGKVWEIRMVDGGRRVCDDVRALVTRPDTCHRFLVLTTVGVYEIERRRMIDRLHVAVLSSLNYGPGEQLTALVVRACVDNPQLQPQLAQLAAVASNSQKQQPAHAAVPTASTANIHPQQQQQQQQHVMVAKTALLDAQPSPLLSGLFISFARVLQDIWTCDVAAISTADLSIFSKLKSLHSIITANAALFPKSDLFYGIVELITRTIQLLSFVFICQDYQILDSARNGEPSASFEGIFSGITPEFIKNAADCLVKKQLQTCSLDTVLQVLAERCPAFFGHSEMLLYSGMELLDRAGRCKETGSAASEFKACVRAAIDSLTGSASSMTFEAFARFLDQLYNLQDIYALQGMVDISASFIAAIDPDNRGLIAYQQPAAAAAAVDECVLVREQCYGRLLEYLGGMLRASPPSPHVLPLLAYTASRVCSDELLHVRIFEFMHSNALTGVMLETMLQSPFLEPYLLLAFNNSSSSNNSSSQGGGGSRDLLWKYYGMTERYADAARVLMAIAESSAGGRIEERVECLSRAVTFAHSDGARSSDKKKRDPTAQLRIDAQDLLDVARVQLELCGRLADAPELHERLFTLSELFNTVARPRGCAEQALRLLELSLQAGTPLTRDLEHLIGQIWHEAIEQALTQDTLLETMHGLLGRFAPPSPVLPFAMLFDHVAQYSHSHSLPSALICDIFDSIGVQMILDAVDQLLDKSSFWAARRAYLARVVVVLAESRAGTAGSLERRLLDDRLAVFERALREDAAAGGVLSDVVVARSRLRH